MLVKLYEGTQDWLVTNTQTVKEYVENFTQKHYQRISALMMASKMFSIVILFALIPFSNQKMQKENPIEVKLDQTNPIPVSGKNRQVAIATGNSNIDIVSGTSSRQIAYAGSSANGVERDPSYFRGLYQKAGSAYGVPWQLIEAVHYVETGCSDNTSESSGAGATGPMQFMPGTWRTYGVDADGNGSADITNVNDAVYGAANLLAQGGAAEGDYQSALFNYNHAQWYVDKVMGIARDAGM